MNNILTNREIKVNGGWYQALHALENYRSVTHADFYNTTSSAGDWEGYILQKVGKVYYFIPFSQVNNWPHSGFTVYTGSVFARFTKNNGDNDTSNEVNSILERLCKE